MYCKSFPWKVFHWTWIAILVALVFISVYSRRWKSCCFYLCMKRLGVGLFLQDQFHRNYLPYCNFHNNRWSRYLPLLIHKPRQFYCNLSSPLFRLCTILHTASGAMLNLFPSTRQQSFNQYKCKKFSEKKFQIIPTQERLANLVYVLANTKLFLLTAILVSR